MGLPFPVYDEGQIKSLTKTQQNRDALKAALRSLWLYDPDIKQYLREGKTLDEIRDQLRGKTENLFK